MTKTLENVRYKGQKLKWDGESWRGDGMDGRDFIIDEISIKRMVDRKSLDIKVEELSKPKTYEQGLEDGRKEVLSKVEELIENGKYTNIFPDAIQYMKKIIIRTKEILLPKNETDEKTR